MGWIVFLLPSGWRKLYFLVALCLAFFFFVCVCWVSSVQECLGITLTAAVVCIVPIIIVMSRRHLEPVK